MVATVIATWVTGLLEPIVPSPARTWLALENVVETFFWRDDTRRRPKEGFRVVVCWLENDRSGVNTLEVQKAFTGVEGIKVVRSSRIIKAEDTGGEWSKSMKERALVVREDWNADLAIVGRVKQSRRVLSLWFVPRSGGGTLGRAERQPYVLEAVTLRDDFHDDLQTQLTVVALNAVAPIADTKLRGRLLDKALREATDNLAKLLNDRTVKSVEHRAALQAVLGNALVTLGEREGNAEKVERAVVSFQAALKVFTRERVPLIWAKTKHNVGTALSVLGERESGTERLKQAVAAYRSALEERTRERVPNSWAETQNNLGIALSALGEHESGTALFEQAVAAHRAALGVYKREHAQLMWATSQTNLGNALWALGERKNGIELLEQAVTAHRAALEEYTRKHVPLHWAGTQNNLGIALFALGQRKSRTELLEQAIAAHRAALGRIQSSGRSAAVGHIAN